MSTEPDLPANEDTQEILRAWLIGDELHCSLRAGVFEDPSSWGEVLADLARHAALAVHEADGGDAVAILQAIRAAFARELADPGEGA